MQDKITSAAFRRIRAEKNEILDRILHYVKLRANDELAGGLANFQAMLLGYFPRKIDPSAMTKHGMAQLYWPIHEISKQFHRLLRASFTFSKWADAEGLRRQNPNRPKHVKIDRLHHEGIGKDTLLGGDLDERLDVMVWHMLSAMVVAYRRGILQGDDREEMELRLKRAFPKTIRVKRQPRLRRLKEAADDRKREDPEIDMGFEDVHGWDEFEQLYTEVNTGYRRDPRLRDDMDIMEFTDLEREATEEFVQQVRDGEVEAANDAGIDDFLWIAVLDTHTCEECCAKRDGLSTKEIEDKLDKEWKNDDCDATVPPAHPNCRCIIAPIDTEKLDKVEVPYKSVDEWLNEGAANL